MKKLIFTYLIVAISLCLGSFSEASSGSSKIKDIFKEKGATCHQKYRDALQSIHNHDGNGATRAYFFSACIAGAFASSVAGPAGVAVGCGAGATIFYVDKFRTSRGIKRILQVERLLNETEFLMAGTPRTQNETFTALESLYNSEADYFNQYQIGSYEALAWTIEDAVETGKACDQGKPWTLAQFRSYAMARIKQKHEEVIENAKKANLLPDESVLTQDKE